MDSLNGVKEVADSAVVVEGIDDVCNVFAKVNLYIPLLLLKLFRTIDKVGGEYLVKVTLLVRLVDNFKTVAEKTEGNEYEYALSTFFLELRCDLNNRVAGGDHIVNDDNVLTFDIFTEIFVSFDRVFAVYDYRVVSALVDHTVRRNSTYSGTYRLRPEKRS